MSTALLVAAAISSLLGLYNEASISTLLMSVRVGQKREEYSIRGCHEPSIPHLAYPRDTKDRKQPMDMHRVYRTMKNTSPCWMLKR